MSLLPADMPALEKTLSRLGEKCRYMSDDECSFCVDKRQYFCLRSLVARYSASSKLFAHKGIELSDIQCQLSLEERRLTAFGFAKLGAGSGHGSLTARNHGGAVLLSQVLGQIDKATFDTVVILSPSTINEDLQERLKLICTVFNKHLLILDRPILMKMLAHFQEQAVFDKLDVAALFKRSWSKPKTEAEKGARKKKRRPPDGKPFVPPVPPPMSPASPPPPEQNRCAG
jgi:hypothetical protein